MPTGHWEWFRIDGTRLRAGSFEAGLQVGDRTPYDRRGRVYEVTAMKRAKLASPARRAAGAKRAPAPKPIAAKRGASAIDAILARLQSPERKALEKLRKAIRAAAPRAEECITYRLPAFRLDGKILVAFGARASHCALYPMSAVTVKAHARELDRYDTSAGTIRFPANRPLPASLVRRLVRARIAENAARAR